MARLRPLAEHGKLVRRTGQGGGGLTRWIYASVPKRLFAHFYALGLVTCVLALEDMMGLGKVVFTAGTFFTARIQVCGACVCNTSRIDRQGYMVGTPTARRVVVQQGGTAVSTLLARCTSDTKTKRLGRDQLQVRLRCCVML